MRALTAIGSTLLLAGCTWVSLTPEGSGVAVRTENQVGNCRQIADTTVSVRDRVIFRRSSDRVAEELEILARNAAGERGGDTIVPVTSVEDGQRNYNIYQCGF